LTLGFYVALSHKQDPPLASEMRAMSAGQAELGSTHRDFRSDVFGRPYRRETRMRLSRFSLPVQPCLCWGQKPAVISSTRRPTLAVAMLCHFPTVSLGSVITWNRTSETSARTTTAATAPILRLIPGQRSAAHSIGAAIAATPNPMSSVL